MAAPVELRENIARILDAHRQGHRDKLQTVEMLRMLFGSISEADQAELCEQLGQVLRTEPLGTKVLRGMGVNIVGVVLLALARFGPTQHLADFVFGRIRFEDSEAMEIWAREVCPDFRYCLYENGDRFADESLSRMESDLGKYRPPDRSLPLQLIEALTELKFILEDIKLTRFEQSLRRTATEHRVKASDLESSLVGLGFNSKIAAAMKDAEAHLHSDGEFEPKKAADLLRTCMDETLVENTIEPREIARLLGPQGRTGARISNGSCARAREKHARSRETPARTPPCATGARS
jgi:hypothetical protein